jgi:hypothetical protein
MTLMTGSDDNGKNPAKLGKSVQPGSRDARLAAALRENLRRRKMQERGRERGRGSENLTEAAGEGSQNPSRGENR